MRSYINKALRKIKWYPYSMLDRKQFYNWIVGPLFEWSGRETPRG